jgi:hypothetical protein
MFTFIDGCIIGSMIAASIGVMILIFCDDSLGLAILIFGLLGMVIFGAMGVMFNTNSVLITYNSANEISISTGSMDVSKIVRIDVVEHLEDWDSSMCIYTIDYPKRSTKYPVSIRPGSLIEVYTTDLDGKRVLAATTSNTFGTTITGHQVQISSPRGNIVDVQEYNKNRRPVVTDITWNNGVQYA